MTNYPSAPPPSGVWEQRASPQPQVGTGLHVGALVCGIMGVLFGLIPILFFIALPLGIIAFVLGIMAYRRAKRAGIKQGRAGIILGSIAIILGVVGIAIVNDAFNDLDNAATSAEVEACIG